MPSEEEEKYYQEQVNVDEGIDLVTVTYFRKDLTKQCLERLFGCTKTSYRLTVVDNGSTDGTRELLMNWYKEGLIANLILLDRNYGLEYVRNTALRHLHSEYCVFFDNDLLCPDLKPDWLIQELALLKKHPEYGCIALRPQILVGARNNLWDGVSEIIENNHVGATFMMFKTSLLKEVKWDDQFTNRVADWRLGDILKSRGLKMGWTQFIYCNHLFGKNWSYPEDVPSFHREIWPPSESYDNIKVDEKTLKPLI